MTWTPCPFWPSCGAPVEGGCADCADEVDEDWEGYVIAVVRDEEDRAEEDLALEIISFLDPEAVEDFKAWRREPRRRTAGAKGD